MPHRGERRFDRIGRAPMLPVLGWEIIKRQQAVTILDQLLDRLGVLGLVSFHELHESLVCFGARGKPSRSPVSQPSPWSAARAVDADMATRWTATRRY